MAGTQNQGRLGFDWDRARAWLEETRAKLAEDSRLSADQERQILDQRARELARVPEDDSQDEQRIEVARFHLGTEAYAIATEFVVGLTRPDHVTPIPQTDPHVWGVTNLRGGVTAVMDLRPLLGIATEPDPTPQVLVLGHKTPELAIVVDEVDYVEMIHRGDIAPLSGSGVSHPELILGCTKEGMTVLNGSELMKCESLIVEQLD